MLAFDLRRLAVLLACLAVPAATLAPAGAALAAGADAGNLRISPAAGVPRGAIYATVEAHTGRHGVTTVAVRAPGQHVLGTGDRLSVLLPTHLAVPGVAIGGDAAPGTSLRNGAFERHGGVKRLGLRPGSAVTLSVGVGATLRLGVRGPAGRLGAFTVPGGPTVVRVTTAADGLARFTTLAGPTDASAYRPARSQLHFGGGLLADATCAEVCCPAAAGNCGAWCAAGGDCTAADGAILGPSGGTVAVADPASPIAGAAIVVPAGALAAQTQLTLAPAPGALPLPAGFGPAGPVVDLEPSGLRFALPALVTVPVAVGAIDPAWLTFFIYDEATGALTAVPARADAPLARLEGQVPHFTHAGGAICGSGTLTNDDCGGGAGNGLDEDGDGLTDECCTCTELDSYPCYTGAPGTAGVGACHGGLQECLFLHYDLDCAGEVVPAAETCNGVDDDCDGATDEDGACCAPAAELCNGLDDDCDGLTDEDFPGVGTACDGPDADLCATGVQVCRADQAGVECVEAGPNREELCNGLDDDCNGTVDDGVCECTVDSDCRLFDVYCHETPCQCVALAPGEPEPVCSGGIVFCKIAPCLFLTPVCEPDTLRCVRSDEVTR